MKYDFDNLCIYVCDNLDRGPGLEGLQLFFLDCSNNLMQLIPGGYQRKKLDDIGKNLFSSNLMTSFSSKVVETMIYYLPVFRIMSSSILLLR